MRFTHGKQYKLLSLCSVSGVQKTKQKNNMKGEQNIDYLWEKSFSTYF